jgi:hypothetical protein
MQCTSSTTSSPMRSAIGSKTSASSVLTRALQFRPFSPVGGIDGERSDPKAPWIGSASAPEAEIQLGLAHVRSLAEFA